MNSLKETAKAHKQSFIIMVISALLSGITIIVQAYLLVTIVDDIFLQRAAFAEVFPIILALLGVLIGRTLFNYFNEKTGVRLATKMKKEVRKKLLQKYTRTNMETALHGQSGSKVSVMLDTVDEIDAYYSNYIPQVIQSAIIPVMLLIVIFMEHAYTGVIILITAPFIPIFMIIIGFNTKDKSEEQLEKMAAFSGKFLDTLQGLTTLKLFGQAKQQKSSIEKSSLDFRDATMVVLKTAFTNSLALEFVSMLSMGLIALEVAIQLIIFQDITFFTGFLMLVLAPEFYNKLKELGTAFHTGSGSKGAFSKIQAELDMPEFPVVWGDNELEKDTPPTITLRDASFSYSDGTLALNNISVTIPANSQLAIVGKTGAGKSTLLHVLAGLVSLSEGEFLLNDKPRANYREKSWFDKLSYISQHPYLFAGTIAENIAIGDKENATREAIEVAGEKAGISELVESLELKYDTSVGEAGRGLSGGEKQRIALARAFLKQPSVIIFDEPTMGLDLRTEKILQQSIKELGERATVITVAHRLHTIKNADQILFIDDGKLVSIGKHEELLESTPSYRSMVAVQQGGVSE